MSEPAPSAPAAPAVPAAPATPAPAAPTPAAPAPPVPAAPMGEPQNVAGLPQWAQELIGNTRAEAAQWRTRAQGTAPQPGDPAAPTAPPAQPQAPEVDVTRLPRWAQQAVTDGQGAARTLAIQSAVIAHAPTAGADITRLLDSQAAMNALAAVDPTDAEAVKQAITNTLTTYPHLAAQTGPIRGGAEFGGTPTGERKPATLEQAIAARMSGG